MFVPFFLIKKIDADVVRAAANEMERVYMNMLRVPHGMVAKGTFNLSQKIATSVEDRIVMELLRYVQASKENMTIKQFDAICNLCMNTLNRECLTRMSRNRIIDNMIVFTALVHARGTTRTRLNGELLTMIRHRGQTQAKIYSEDEIIVISQEVLANAKAY